MRVAADSAGGGAIGAAGVGVGAGARPDQSRTKGSANQALSL